MDVLLIQEEYYRLFILDTFLGIFQFYLNFTDG